MKCRYWDCGWCCAPIDVVTSASSCGSCIYPEHCLYLKTEMTNQQPEVMSSGTAIISDENGVPTKVHLSDKEKLTEMTEKMDSVKSIEAQIKMLQSKLEFYKEVEKTPPSSVEEAYKKVFGCYPQTDVGDGYWEYFQNGYKQAQKDYKVGEHQEPVKQKDTLYDICADWYKDYDEDHPIEDLVEYIARNWLPKPSDGGGAWDLGFNSYHKILIDTLGGGND